MVYIVCRGHSGSTLLDLLLSSHREVASVGELKLLARGREPRCTCAEGRVRDCVFWQHVSACLAKRTGRTLFELPIESADREELVAANHAIYEEVANAAGVSVVVDSSKDPVRLARLLADDSFDLRVIHLIRHPHGVVYSAVRKGRRWWREALHYGLKLGDTEQLLAHRAHRTVRYEALVEQPEAVVRDLMQWIGLCFDPSQLEWSGRVRHNVGGNRMRFATTSEIRSDDAWKQLAIYQRVGILVLVHGMRLVARVRSRGVPPD